MNHATTRIRAEGQAVLDGVRRERARAAAEQEKTHRGRLEEFDRDTAEREAAVDNHIADLTEYAERLVAEAQQAHADAQEAAAHRQADADAEASVILAQARATEERIGRDSERELREHEARREEIKAHLAHVRTSLATLTGRVEPLDDEDDDEEEGKAADAKPEPPEKS